MRFFSIYLKITFLVYSGRPGEILVNIMFQNRVRALCLATVFPSLKHHIR